MKLPRAIGVAGLATLALVMSGAAIAQSTPPPGGPPHQGGMTGAKATMPSRHGTHFVRIYDTNGNGTVSMDEIKAEQKRILAAADIDSNGSLSVDEFRRRGRSIQSLGTTTLFDMLDINGDRAISADELAAPFGMLVRPL